jgi:hypothetical protein
MILVPYSLLIFILISLQNISCVQCLFTWLQVSPLWFSRDEALHTIMTLGNVVMDVLQQVDDANTTWVIGVEDQPQCTKSMSTQFGSVTCCRRNGKPRKMVSYGT